MQRTLAAADNALLLIDGAKGIEPQTRKLFAVARLRGLPVFSESARLAPLLCIILPCLALPHLVLPGLASSCCCLAWPCQP